MWLEKILVCSIRLWSCCCTVAKLCPTICDSMACSTLDFSVLPYLPEFTQIHVLWVDEAIQPSHPLSPPSLLALNLSQHQGLFQWVVSLHQVAEVLEFQLQHQFFQQTFRNSQLQRSSLSCLLSAVLTATALSAHPDPCPSVFSKILPFWHHKSAL